MPVGTLSGALEQEHREIDAGLEAFTSSVSGPQVQRAALSAAIGGLRRHIYLEEAFLFPALRAAGLVAPVFVMIREHGEIWRSLDRLEEDLAAGAEAGPMLEVCKELANQLESHNMKEEQILYPQADRVLTAPASDALAAFLRSGQMPGGWICAGAKP